MKKIRVFVTDAGYKHTLAAVRCLGKRGIHVIAGSHKKHSQAFYSKYCNEKVICPDPKNLDTFAKFMLDYVKENPVDVILPIGYFATIALSKHKKKFAQHTKLPVADYKDMEIASNKDRTMRFASEAGIRIPRTYTTVDEIDRYPIVVKGTTESGQIRYVNSQEELETMNLSDSILQEYISGEGYGLYALFNEGSPRAIFMHKRLREYPITGGASTAAESVYDQKLKDFGLKLLESLNWHGVAMVEFKKDRLDGEFKLMEVNPKFWGSLDLSIASGVEFPYLAVRMAMNGDIDPVFEYKLGTRFRWPFPDDLLHTAANPRFLGGFIGEFFNKDFKDNIDSGDLGPNVLQLIRSIGVLGKRIRNRNLRYPHGIPKVIT